ncbi:MAG: hypothetical protein HY234_08660 [Acidobacteria bacterium]|nr:hypothetical protein [Acidobacteriota bacterium]MBI3663103.1 hypothetical protein [Acidobacteriota bacterium]
MRHILVSAIIFVIAVCGALARGPQQGPVTPPPGREIKRIPLESAPEQPPIPVEELIRRIAERENEIIRVRNASTYQVSLRLQEFDERGETVGEFQMTTDVLLTPDGKPYEKVIRSSRSTLLQLSLPSEELAEFGRIRPFMLPSVSLPYYELKYAGKQPLDELTTFLFRVRPRRLERARRFFEGVIWVDDRDFAIVKTYGKWISEVDAKTGLEPFVFFESFRENVEGKYWFPSFMRSEETLKSEGGPARLRLTIRYTNYKTGAAPAPGTPPR